MIVTQLTRHQKNKSPFLFHISLYTHVRLQTSPRFNLHALWLVKKATFLILVSPYWFHEINFWPMIYKIFLNTTHIMHGSSNHCKMWFIAFSNFWIKALTVLVTFPPENEENWGHKLKHKSTYGGWVKVSSLYYTYTTTATITKINKIHE